MRAAQAGSWRDRAGLVALGCAAAYLPFTLLGYGTDIDVANVLRAGRTWLETGDYELSRGPGAPVHELGTAVLDRLGGSVLVNLASVAFAALAVWSLHHLARRDGARWPAAASLVLATNPWFWVAATSLGDFVWALGLVLAGAVAASRDRRALAGVLFGLAVGCRASSVLLAGAWLAAERTGAPSFRPPRRDTAVTAGVLAVVAVASFVPPWLDAGRTFEFVRNELEVAGLGVHVGRWAVKNLALVGLAPLIVLVLGTRPLLGGVARWRASTVVRFAVASIVAVEVLFLRFPFKPLHLLPVVAGVALLVGASPAVTRRWLTTLVAAQLVSALVGVTVAAPDVADRARSGRLDVSITTGPLLTDLRCRLDDRALGEWPDPASDAATQRATANAACQNETWRGG